MTSQLFAPGPNLPTFHLDKSHDRPACADGRADFGTGNCPFSLLVSPSSSLPAGWPSTRATPRACSSRFFKIVTLFRQDTSFGIGHRIAGFWQGPTSDGRLASGGGAGNRQLGQFFVNLHETLRVAVFCTTSSRRPFSRSRGRLFWSPESRGQLCVWSKEHVVESCVFSVVIGVFAGWALHSRFAKGVASWRRRLVESPSEAPGPSVPGRVLFAPSYRSPVWSVQVRTRITCRFPKGRVAGRTSRVQELGLRDRLCSLHRGHSFLDGRWSGQFFNFLNWLRAGTHWCMVTMRHTTPKHGCPVKIGYRMYGI